MAVWKEKKEKNQSEKRSFSAAEKLSNNMLG